MRLSLPGFCRDERGATAIEYGLMAALLAIIAIAGFTVFGTNLAGLFNYTSNRVTSVLNNAAG